jgi:hypothetical protein
VILLKSTTLQHQTTKYVQSQMFHPAKQNNKAPIIDRGFKHKASGHHNFEETNWQHGQPLVKVSNDQT